MTNHQKSYRQALSYPIARQLLTAHGASSFAQQVVSVVLYAQVLKRHLGPGWVPVIASAGTVPYVLFSSFGGALSDRFRKRELLRAVYLVRAALFVGLAVMLAADLQMGWSIGVLAITHLLATPCYPAIATWTVEATPISYLAVTTSMLGLAGSGAFFIGPAIGGALAIADLGPVAPSLSVVLLIVAFISLGDAKDHAAAELSIPGNPPVVVAAESSTQSLFAGLRHIGSSIGLISVIVFMLLIEVVFGSLEVLSAVIARDALHQPSALGTLTIAIGLGAFASILVVRRLISSRRGGLVLMALAVACGIPLILVGHSTTLTVLAIGLAISSAANLAAEIMVTNLIQHTVPDSVMGSVFGIMDSMMLLGVLAGGLLAPLLANRWAIGTVITLLGVVTIVGGVGLAPLFMRLSRRSLNQQAEISDVVTTLRKLDILSGVNSLGIELLARHFEVEFPRAGQEIVRQGDSPDDLYILIEGTCSIDILDSEGELVEVNRITGLDSFGEIGLLKRIPRTASVLAMDQCTVWRIPGSRFLDAVSNGQVMTASSLQRIEIHLSDHERIRKIVKK